jgi:hypothetical protein
LNLFAREMAYDLRFYAVDKVGNAEAVRQENFTVDTTPPRSQHKIEGAFYGTQLSPQSIISLNSIDHLSGVKEIRFAFDENKKQKYIHQLTANSFNNLNEGEHTLSYSAVDNVGNTETERTFTFFYDPAPPTVSLQILGDLFEAGNQTFVSSRSQFQLDAKEDVNEVKKIIFQIDNGKKAEYSKPVSFPQTEGMHSITYYCLDFVDNKSAVQKKIVILDKTAPVTNFHFEGSYYADGKQQFISPNTKLVLNTADNKAGVKSVYYKLDQNSWKVYSQPIIVNDFGNYQFKYYAQDNVNNNENLKTVTFFVDSVKPQITIKPDKTAGQGKLPTNALIYLSAEDAHTGIERITYSINGGREQLYRGPISGFRSGETVEICVTAYDRVGNSAKKTITYLIVVEK